MNQRLSRNQFDILVKMAEKPEILSQRQLGELTGCSLGTVNSVMKEFVKEGFTENGRITSGGLAALEPYRVKRAIFIAAGFGTRLVPAAYRWVAGCMPKDRNSGNLCCKGVFGGTI